MNNNPNLLDDIDSEVTDEDMVRCNNALSKPDRIGKYAVWLCVIFFAIAGWYIVDANMADMPVEHPWYSKIPLVGEKLWTPPKSTQLPIVGQKIHDIGLQKFLGLIGGILVGFIIGKLISAMIRNGARQDERNKRKISQ